jgi:hypothetical protein
VDDHKIDGKTEKKSPAEHMFQGKIKLKKLQFVPRQV